MIILLIFMFVALFCVVAWQDDKIYWLNKRIELLEFKFDSLKGGSNG